MKAKDRMSSLSFYLGDLDYFPVSAVIYHLSFHVQGEQLAVVAQGTAIPSFLGGLTQFRDDELASVIHRQVKHRVEPKTNR